MPRASTQQSRSSATRPLFSTHSHSIAPRSASLQWDWRLRNLDAFSRERDLGGSLAAVEPAIKDPFIKGGDISSPTGAGRKLWWSGNYKNSSFCTDSYAGGTGGSRADKNDFTRWKWSIIHPRFLGGYYKDRCFWVFSPTSPGAREQEFLQVIPRVCWGHGTRHILNFIQ